MDTQIFDVCDFARQRHFGGENFTQFIGSIPASETHIPSTIEGLIDLIKKFWDNRTPGFGRTDIDEVVLVHLSPKLFTGVTVGVTKDHRLESSLYARQDGEEPFIKTVVVGKMTEHGLATPAYPDPCNFAYVVLYNRKLLTEDDLKGTNPEADWIVVALVASPSTEEEPPHPITLVRNFLEKTGGTKAPLTVEELAASVWYWKDKCSVAS